jgi:hypothetical protein
MTINTKDDFNSATPEQQAAFKQLLQGSIYRLEKDDTLACWKAVEDTSTIERYGFTKADFPDAVAPALPVYVAPALPDYTALRLNDYRNESDPLFFKWQRGEVTQEEWLAKVAEIKARSYDVSN